MGEGMFWLAVQLPGLNPCSGAGRTVQWNSIVHAHWSILEDVAQTRRATTGDGKVKCIASGAQGNTARNSSGEQGPTGVIVGSHKALLLWATSSPDVSVQQGVSDAR